MPGIEPAVTSPFGNGPSNLDPQSAQMRQDWMAKNPGQDPDKLVNPSVGVNQPQPSQVGGMAPQPGQNAGPGGAPPAPSSDQSAGAPDADLDQFLNTLGDNANAAQAAPQPPEGPLANIKQQLQESLTRVKNSFAVTGQESLDTLKSSGLFTDVRKNPDNDEIEVKWPGKDKWAPFKRDLFSKDPAGWVMDHSRDILEGVITGGFEAAGIAAGSIAAPGAGTVGGAMAGGAAGSLVAKNAGDIIAQDLLGIKRDKNRNELTEQAMTAGLGAIFGPISNYFAGRAIANKAVRAEAQKTLDFATQQAKNASDDIAKIGQSGIKLGQDGKFHLDPQQMVGAGAIPELDATAKELSTEQSFRNFRRNVTDHVVGAYDTIAKSFGAAAGKGVNLGEDFVLTSQDVRNVEGKMIGEFRDQAENQLKGVSQPTPRLLQTVQMVKDAMPSAGYAERQLGLTPPQAKNFMREIDVMTRLLGRTGGQMRVDTAYALEKRLTQQINSNINSANGRQYAIALMDLRNAVRDDGMDMMESAFKQMSPQGGGKLLSMFQQSRQRYAQIMDATRTLGNTLQNENISRNALIGKLFEGKDAYKFAKSAKTLIDETNPGLWNQLSSEFFQKMRNDATNPVTNSVDWGSMSKKWANMDPRMKQDLLGSTGIPAEGMDALMRLGTRVQGTSFDAMAKPSTESMVKGALKQIFTWYGGGATAKGAAAGNLLDGLGKDQAVARWLQAGGLEEVLKEMPGMNPGKAAALRQAINNWAPRTIRRQQPMTRRRTEAVMAEGGI